jgi:flagella basal body P-ring formation protein FlgA
MRCTRTSTTLRSNLMWRLTLILAGVPLLAGVGCLPISSNRITPRDLSTSLAFFSAASDPAVVLAPAPPPGQQLTVTAAEVSLWAHRAGITAGEISPICLVRQGHRLDKRDVEAAIRPQLPAAAILDVISYSGELLPIGHAAFPAAGAKPNVLHPKAALQWRGYWEADDGSRVEIWARVSAWRVRNAVRLKGSRQEGAVLTPEEIERAEIITSAFDPAPDESISDYSGKIVRRFLPEGALLDARQVESAPVVTRNSIINVHVVSGQLRLELAAKAESDAWLGDSVDLTAAAGHRRFQALVQPDGSALLVVTPREMHVELKAAGD